jgi:hypothetical protein
MFLSAICAPLSEIATVRGVFFPLVDYRTTRRFSPSTGNRLDQVGFEQPFSLSIVDWAEVVGSNPTSSLFSARKLRY